MSDLQTAFYIIGIIYMSLMFLLAVTIVVALLVIKSKINRMQRIVNARIHAVRDTADHLAAIIRAARSVLRGH